MTRLLGFTLFLFLFFASVATSQTGPSLKVIPASYSFTLHNGAPPPPPALIPLVITSTGAQLSVTISTTTDNGVGWISASSGGSTPASIIVSLNANPFMDPSGLVNDPAATYQGSVIVSAPGAANSPVSVPITLTIDGNSAPSPSLSIVPQSLSFSLQNGLAPPPHTQSLTVTSAAGTLIVSASWSSSWLAVQGGGDDAGLRHRESERRAIRLGRSRALSTWIISGLSNDQRQRGVKQPDEYTGYLDHNRRHHAPSGR